MDMAASCIGGELITPTRLFFNVSVCRGGAGGRPSTLCQALEVLSKRVILKDQTRAVIDSN